MGKMALSHAGVMTSLDNAMHQTACSRKSRVAGATPLDFGKMAPLHAGDLTIRANAMHQPVFTQVSGGWSHSLGLRKDGTIACWGLNDQGQCDAPTGVFTQVAGGVYHSIGLREDGTIVGWGNNVYGQCDAPDAVFTQVAGGSYHTIGLQEDGTIACWGSNFSGECDAQTVSSGRLRQAAPTPSDFGKMAPLHAGD